jgi:hypothetical protein
MIDMADSLTEGYSSKKKGSFSVMIMMTSALCAVEQRTGTSVMLANKCGIDMKESLRTFDIPSFCRRLRKETPFKTTEIV